MIKNRLLRRILFVLVVLAVTGWFAFSTLLFSPTEGDLEADVSILVPTSVDFFLAKARLDRDFDEFPRLRAASTLARTKAWRTFERSPEYEDLMTGQGVRDTLEQIERELDRVPSLPGLELPAVFGGRDLAVAGRFTGPTFESSDWVAYGRVNFWGKLAVSALRYPGLLRLEQQGLMVENQDGVLTLSGGALLRPIYVTRERDVVVVGTAAEIVNEVRELAVRGGQDSFGQSARYYDNIAQSRLRSDGDELEAFVDVRALLESRQMSGRWPDPDSQDFLPALLGRVFQLGSVNEVVGVADFNSGIQIDLRGELASNYLTPVQSRLYRTQGFEDRVLFDAARLARSDSSLFVFAQLDLAEFLRQVFASYEESVRSLIEDSLRSTGRYQDAEQFISELDGFFRNRVAIIVRPNDFKYNYEGELDKQDPPHDGMPVPAVAVVFWTTGDAKAQEGIDELHNLIVQHQGKLAIEGHTPGSKGVFYNEIFGGNVLWEFWNKQIPGTGHLASVQSVDLYIASNSYKMVESILRTYYFGEPRDPRLADLPQFQALATSSLQVANVACWLAPERMAVTRREQADLTSRDEVLSAIDWAVERPKAEREVLDESFSGRGRSLLTPGEQAELDTVVSERLGRWQEDLLTERVPEVRARHERAIIYSEAFTGILAMLELDQRSMSLSVRAMAALEE